MPVMKYSMLNNDWEMVGDAAFVSPLPKAGGEEMLVFSDRIKNGSISADITLLEGLPRRGGETRLEAALVVRYAGKEGYYYGGTSAWGTKFFLGKVLPGPYYQLREYVGVDESIRPNKTYRLRIEFNGSQITLFENDVEQMHLFDEGYQVGQCALRSWSTRARFENVEVKRAQPRAFVVMPFDSELSFVHRVVEEAVRSYGIDCVRADQVAISRPVMDDVKKMIAEADLVLVDFTGKNPNVYYEAGLADAWKKDWIVLAQTSEDMTFDVRHIRSIRYSNRMGADRKLEEDLRRAIEALGYHTVAPASAAPSPPAALTQPVATATPTGSKRRTKLKSPIHDMQEATRITPTGSKRRTKRKGS